KDIVATQHFAGYLIQRVNSLIRSRSSQTFIWKLEFLEICD
ncbi:unnamed protein product, partial [Allacma fusca]